jgi:hypothetical protein
MLEYLYWQGRASAIHQPANKCLGGYSFSVCVHHFVPFLVKCLVYVNDKPRENCTFNGALFREIWTAVNPVKTEL